MRPTRLETTALLLLLGDRISTTLAFVLFPSRAQEVGHFSYGISLGLDSLASVAVSTAEETVILVGYLLSVRFLETTDFGHRSVITSARVIACVVIGLAVCTNTIQILQALAISK